MPRIVTLLSDFGYDSNYVGIMKGVLYWLCPDALLVDLTHNVEPQNILEGAFLLYTSYAPFPTGTIHVAVVDPGVGTHRRAICIQVPEIGYFVGPDNGLFSYIIDQYPNAQVREITNLSFMHHPISPTFHGRDIFAPTAARLAHGEKFEEAGPLLDKSTMVLLNNIWPNINPVIPDSRKQLSSQALHWLRLFYGVNLASPPTVIVGQVVHIDHFGNLITNISRQEFDEIGFSTETTRILVEPSHQIMGIHKTYGHAAEDKIIALFGSSGFLEIARVNGRADTALGQKITTGQTVHLGGVISSAGSGEAGGQNY